MYGSTPALQGPIATAVGGIDFSWLAGTVTAAGVYFALGYRRFRTRIDAGVPLGLKAGIGDEDVLRQQQERERRQEATGLAQGAAPEAEPESAPAPLG
jgi:nucleobase:cation symporter-1, NCS1 family